MTTTTTKAGVRAPRSEFRSVALPSEHGGWGLTAEPALARGRKVRAAIGAEHAVVMAPQQELVVIEPGVGAFGDLHHAGAA